MKIFKVKDYTRHRRVYTGKQTTESLLVREWMIDIEEEVEGINKEREKVREGKVGKSSPLFIVNLSIQV